MTHWMYEWGRCRKHGPYLFWYFHQTKKRKKNQQHFQCIAQFAACLKDHYISGVCHKTDSPRNLARGPLVYLTFRQIWHSGWLLQIFLADPAKIPKNSARDASPVEFSSTFTPRGSWNSHLHLHWNRYLLWEQIFKYYNYKWFNDAIKIYIFRMKWIQLVE